MHLPCDLDGLVEFFLFGAVESHFEVEGEFCHKREARHINVTIGSGMEGLRSGSGGSEIKFLVEVLLYHALLHVIVLLSDELVVVLLLSLLLLVPVDQLIEGLGVVVIDVLVDSRFESYHQLLLDFGLDVGSDQGLGLPDAVPPLSLLLDRHQFLLALQPQLAHLDDHLPQFSESLLALVDLEGRPVDEVLVDLLEGPCVGLVEAHFFPELVREVGAFGCLHVQVADALLLADGGVLGVGQRAGLAVAETGEVELVAAEVLGIRSG